MMSRSYPLLVFALLFLNLVSDAQILINGSFEDDINCPESIQFDQLSAWFPLVQSPDVYSCGVTGPSCGLNGIAASGTAYAGFGAMGGNAAEGIGQTLLAPLVEGESYTISFAAKNCAEGLLASSCTGICVYGIEGIEFMESNLTHASLFNGAIELACTPVLTNVDWEYFTFTFTPEATIDHLLFTTGMSADCLQMMFIDDIQLVESNEEEEEEEEEEGEEQEVGNDPLEANVFIPNAFTPNLDGTNEAFGPILSFTPDEYLFQVVNHWGEVIFSSSNPKEQWMGNVNGGQHFAQPGVYVYMLTVRGGALVSPKVFKGHVTLIR